jgi:multiple sugar transport system ATP-binding protein
MGRAIVREPQAYLMDEPLSNLDAKLRVSMRGELARLHERLRVTTVYVTHDQIEAMTLGDRVAVLKDGQLMQVDSPQNLYEHPANLFVATFIGSPSMNLVTAKLVNDGGRPTVTFADYKLPLTDTVEGLDAYVDRDVIVGIRPSSFEDAQFVQESGRPTMKVDIDVTEELGSEVNLLFAINSPPVHHEVMIAKFDKSAQDEPEGDVIAGEGRSPWTARVNPRTRAKAGRSIELAVDTRGMHFFDIDSGLAIGPGASRGDSGTGAGAVSVNG